MTEQKENPVKLHGLTVKVREKCLEAGFTTAYQLQKAAGLAPSVAQNLFNGTFSEISLQTLEKLLVALDCTAGDLFVKEKSELQIARRILRGARRILVLTGAGVSAESNVPTFRGAGGASVWRGIPFEQLSSKQMVEENLPLVWEWFDYRRETVGKCETNAAHKTLADWQRAGDFDEFTLVTQNVDGLHRQAGSSRVLELHGNIWRARCQMCGETFDVRELPADERPPLCRMCGDFLRPNVVLFGENLPARIFDTAQNRARSCDVCLVVGTSSLVYPAASLPEIARAAGAKIIEINPEPTDLTESADIFLRGKAGEILPQLLESVITELSGSGDWISQPPEKGDEDDLRATEKSAENPKETTQTPKGDFMTSETHPLRVDFLRSEEFPELQKLGMTFAPGKKQRGAVSGNWNRGLTADISRLKEHYKVDALISLVEESELDALGIRDLERECGTHNFEILRFPIKDFSIPPDPESFARLIAEIVGRLKQDKTVVVHCKGGLGRAGMTAACTAVAATNNQISGDRAIEIVRAARKGTVETAEQGNFVRSFGELWQEYKGKLKAASEQPRTDKELVLTFACEGGGANIYRQRAENGEWIFLSEGSDMRVDEADYSWTRKEFNSFIEAIKGEVAGYHIFLFTPLFIHPEHRAEVKKYLENLYKNLPLEDREYLQSFTQNSAVTPESWLARADQEMESRIDPVQLDSETEEGDFHTDNPLSGKSSDKHFLLYWQERSVLDAMDSGYRLDVISSRQLKRVNSGDTVWIVTVSRAGELILAGKLKVDEVVDYQTAVRRLHDPNLWDGGYYALPKPGAAQPMQLINLESLAFDLRFKSSGADRLKQTGGKINAQQMQSMRELSEESALLLARIWENAADEKDDDFGDFDEFEDENDPAKMLEQFRQLVSENPFDAEAHYNLGVAFDENNLPEDANAVYLKAIGLNPDYWAAYYNLGQNQLRAGELGEAEISFEAAIRLAPEFAPASFMLGVVYGEMRDYEKAIAVTKKGLEFDSDDPMAYFNIGNFYTHLRDCEKAAVWFEESLKIEPNAPNTFYRLAKCYRELGEKDKEFNAYLDAVKLAPDFVDALFALGTAYAHLTRTAEGEQVSHFEPGNEFSLLDARVFFYMGLGILGLGNIEEARGTQEHLREMDEHLAEQLQFFIDRYVPEERSDDDLEKFDFQWLEPEESGFNIRVLDCRPFTETRISFAAEEQNVLTFLSTRDSDGEHHRGKSPENARTFSCDLSYPINALIYSRLAERAFETRDLPEGKLFSAAEMEEKWDVYYFDRYFYFVRSWSDKIAYRARAEEDGLYLNITEIEYDGERDEERDYHLQAIDYLLKTFVIGLIVPHPVPADVDTVPEDITVFSFSFAGRHAKFASFENTINAIPALQAMDHVGFFDNERIREYEEQRKSNHQTAASQERELIEISIDGRTFEAKNIPQLYKAVLQYLVDTEKLDNISIPVATGDKRYILAQEPVHPTGKPFLASVEYKGFFMEAHNNRAAAIAQLEKLIKSAGCTFHPYSLIAIANRINEAIRINGHKIDYGQIGTYIYAELEEGNISGVEQFFQLIKDNLTDYDRAAVRAMLAEAKQKASFENQASNSIKPISKLDVFQGCLLGGAVGDALGAAIEFDSIQTIRRNFGEQGLTDYAPAYGRIGAVTDDTQMTLFTAEGLLRAITRQKQRELCGVSGVIYHAYLRWLETQGVKLSDESIKSWVYDSQSWLRDLPELNSRRAPGNSCLSALQSGRMGEIENPINNSKGCGGVMRVAPVGLIAIDAFNLACEAAAITHGHPTGYLSAGVLALIINQIINGKTLIEAIKHAVYEELPKHKGHEEPLAACDKAVKMAMNKTVQPSPETIETLGGGWIAEEALAIAIYCSLAFENDFKEAVLLAVNHSGDSDSTGAITGNILGALHGTKVIPDHWLERLELKEAIAEIAEDLLIGFRTSDEWCNKYPGV